MTLPARETHRRRAGGLSLREFLADRSGLSAIEFAIILPVILMLFAATFDLGVGLMVSRRVAQIASVTSDIVARDPDWTDSQLDTLIEGTTSVLDSFTASKPKVQLAILDIDSKSQATVNWSYGYNTTALTAASTPPVTVPASIAKAGVQLVLTIVSFDQKTILTSLLGSVTGLKSYPIKSTALARPRVGDSILRK